MSTRGFIGIGTAEQFNGRYNHFDSYPTGLGPEVWSTVQRFLHQDRHVHGFAKLLLGYTDWRQVAGGGRCDYCGQITGQPHSISGLIYLMNPDHLPSSKAALLHDKEQVARQHQWPLERLATLSEEVESEWEVAENLRATGYPDPEAKYHEHDSDNPEDSAITPENVDWLFMEWAYIIDSARNRLHVMVGCIETPITYRVEIIRPSGSRDYWNNKTRYTSALVGSYDLMGSEPDWAAVEAAGNALNEKLVAEFAANPHHPLLDTVRAMPSVEVWDQRDKVSS